MKLTQLKWIAVSLIATGLAAGGAVAVSYASAGNVSAGDSPALAPAPEVAEVQKRVSSSPRILKGWGEPIDPDGDCDFKLADGRLTIKVPAPSAPRKGHGLEAEAKALNAPRVLREIEGDFIADLKVGGTLKPFGPSANPRVFPFVGAGLLLWSDEGNFLRLERAAIDRNGQLISYALFQERRDSRLMPPDGGKMVPDGPILLRLERHGDQFSAQVSSDGMAWIAFPPRIIKLPAKLKLGVAAISSSRQPFVVTFENFRVLRPE
jgi:regulation of enolase protein 1 (concanavalin A-like superfamily)